MSLARFDQPPDQLSQFHVMDLSYWMTENKSAFIVDIPLKSIILYQLAATFMPTLALLSPDCVVRDPFHTTQQI